jgi:hypothetical protein
MYEAMRVSLLPKQKLLVHPECQQSTEINRRDLAQKILIN